MFFMIVSVGIIITQKIKQNKKIPYKACPVFIPLILKTFGAW